MEVVNSDSWKMYIRYIKPMPAKIVLLDYTANFTPEEFEKISRGFIPQEMEDKWFIFLNGKTLKFHRSWTGHCIYQVEFYHNREKFSVYRAIANRDQEQYGQSDDAYDSQMLHFLISNFLLGRKEPFPMPSDLPKNTPKGIFQHHISGSGYPEANLNQKQWWKFWK